MQLLQQLANGDCAIKNDGTVEDLNRVLLHVFTEDSESVGNDQYFFRGSSPRTWDSDDETNLPVHSIKEFIAEMDGTQTSTDDFVLPEKWCVYIMSDNVEVIRKFAKEHPILTYGYFNYPDMFWTGGKMNAYTEITFEQFKKYVLKEDEKDLPEITVPTKCGTKTINGKGTIDQFAVMIKSGGSPTLLHSDYESAETECLRLVKETKRDGYVLKVVSKISNQIKIEKV